MDSKFFWQISLTLLTGVAFLFYVVAPDLPFLSLGYSLLLVFFLPGYMIMTAVFTTDLLGIPERIGYAITLSLASTALSGLVLNVTDWGLQSTGWVSMLTIITLIASVIGFLRISHVTIDIDADMSAFSVNFNEIFIMGIATVVGILALLLARAGAERVPPEKYTEFWMVPQTETVLTITLGIRNREQEPVSYRIQLSTRNNAIEEWDTISLDSGEVWEERYPIPRRYAASTFFQANLYRLDDPSNIYRRVTIDYEPIRR